MAESTVPPPRGIVRAPEPDGLLVGRRLPPTPQLAPYIHHFWWIRWELRSPFTAEVLSHPAAQILHTRSGADHAGAVLGTQTGLFARTLSGEGETFGLTFRPAMFQPLLGASMATLTDRVWPIERVLGATALAWTDATLEATSVEEKIVLAERYLEPRLSPPAAAPVQIRDLAERIAADRSLARVEDLVVASGLGLRDLQRASQLYLGVSPKWVIQRHRLHEATARLGEPERPPLADLAQALGYADQAHFGRDFRAAIGETPHRFGLWSERAASSRRATRRG